MSDPRAYGRQLARESIERGDPFGWFERLYVESRERGFAISWVDLEPNPYLVAWLREQETPLHGRAAVVGCGYGDDAELLAGSGLEVVAFDIAPAAIATCKERFPESAVEYTVADATNPPAEWRGAFDFVFEAYTVQVLVGSVRAECARRIGELVAPGGRLLVVARARKREDPEGLMPWPLLREELDEFLAPRVRLANLAEVLEPGDPPVPRFVAEFAREH